MIKVNAMGEKQLDNVLGSGLPVVNVVDGAVVFVGSSGDRELRAGHHRVVFVLCLHERGNIVEFYYCLLYK